MGTIYVMFQVCNELTGASGKKRKKISWATENTHTGQGEPPLWAPPWFKCVYEAVQKKHLLRASHSFSVEMRNTCSQPKATPWQRTIGANFACILLHVSPVPGLSLCLSCCFCTCVEIHCFWDVEWQRRKRNPHFFLHIIQSQKSVKLLAHAQADRKWIRTPC